MLSNQGISIETFHLFFDYCICIVIYILINTCISLFSMCVSVCMCYQLCSIYKKRNTVAHLIATTLASVCGCACMFLLLLLTDKIVVYRYRRRIIAFQFQFFANTFIVALYSIYRSLV